MQLLQGRVAVITGAASGIGLALAQRFARAGMRLVLADIEPEPLQRAQRLLAEGGADVVSQRTDVADAASVEALADAAYARFGAVHLLCNNAGVTSTPLSRPVWQTSVQEWQWVLGVNLLGVVHGLRAFVPRMLAGGDEGHIVNTASVAGLLTGSGPYFASKHGVMCVSEGLTKDLRRAGARLSASVLCPGIIRTAILEAERNRPLQFGAAPVATELDTEAQRRNAEFRAALEAGLDPALVADAVHDAVLADRFYVIPSQPELLALIDLRLADLGARRNPTLPPAQ